MSACLPLALLLVSCGYRFTAGEGRLPDGSRQISIPMAGNLTSEATVGAWLTSALRTEARRAGLELSGETNVPKLVAKVVRVEAIPRGVAVFGGRYRTREQEVVVEVEMRVEFSTSPPWLVRLTDRESYLSAPDLRGTEANRASALRLVLDRVAQSGVERLSRGF
jgi:hypothetical protein